MPRRPNLFQFQAVLFDVDGTLIDSLYCITQGLSDTINHFCGYRPEAPELRQLIGMPLLKQMALYAPNPEQVTEMADLAMRQMASYSDEEKPFAAAVECLKHCSVSGIKTALVTSKNSYELASFMERFEGRSYVNATVCASDVSSPKPSPESAFLACSLLEISPANCVFVGDSIFDMRCAKSAGIASIAVAYGAGDKRALEAENPDLLLSTPEELLAWAHETTPLNPCHERK